MKKTLLLVLTISFFGSMAVISRSGGLGAVGGQIRTLSPAHPGQCANCHAGGAGTGGMAISVVDGANNVVTSYAPNTNYTIIVGINNTIASIGGFQIECLDGLNAKAGTFAAGIGSQLTTINPYEVVEHATPGTFAVMPLVGNSVGWQFSWTSPATAGASLTFYAVGNAANGNGNTGGDHGYATSYGLSSLPVTFTSVEAFNFNNEVELLWTVEEQEESGIYLIERAGKDGVFEMIGEKVQTEDVSYRFRDASAPLGQALQYRIRQTSLSGEERVSRVVSTILSPAQSGIVKVYPNPPRAGEQINMRYWAEQESMGTIRWMSMDGRTVGEQAIDFEQGENALRLMTPSRAGRYMLEVIRLGKKDNRVVIVQ
ncbi:MAG: choice-of-anchor V domain-containing protein [Bacteroidia bacterium]